MCIRDSDGCAGVSPDGPDDVHAVQVGQAEVQNYDIRGRGGGLVEGVGAIGGGADLVTTGGEVERQRSAHFGVVFDDQHARLAVAHRSSSSIESSATNDRSALVATSRAV